MHNPPHPGVVLREWMNGPTVVETAEALQVTRVTLTKILNGKGGITADMALRLSQWLGASPDLWLGMQNQYDLCLASQATRPDMKPTEMVAG